MQLATVQWTCAGAGGDDGAISAGCASYAALLSAGTRSASGTATGTGRLFLISSLFFETLALDSLPEACFVPLSEGSGERRVKETPEGLSRGNYFDGLLNMYLTTSSPPT